MDESINDSFIDSPREILSKTPDIIDVVEAGRSRIKDLLGAEAQGKQFLQIILSLNWWKGCWNWMFELSEGLMEDDDVFESMVERILSTLRTKKLASS